MSEEKYIGVIGSGSFGTAMSNLLACNNKVLLYTRRKEVKEKIELTRENRGQEVHESIEVSTNIEEIAKKCTLIFLVVDSANFRSMMQGFSAFLKPYHLLIHCTKGLNYIDNFDPDASDQLNRTQIRTMTEVIKEESSVVRVGCLSGPNLAKEISNHLPAGTVIASKFQEVIDAGKEALKSDRFRVYQSKDVLGVELAGVLKNVLALSSGMISGLAFGENCRSLMITRGLGEMIRLSRALGSNGEAFLGLAGIGDIIATCASSKSRNFTVGYRLAKGDTLEAIIESMNEVAEGVKTTKMAWKLSNYYKLETPIIDAIYGIIYENNSIKQAMSKLMTHYYDIDADYLG